MSDKKRLNNLSLINDAETFLIRVSVENTLATIGAAVALRVGDGKALEECSELGTKAAEDINAIYPHIDLFLADLMTLRERLSDAQD
jgi:hypothetical protein